MGAIPTSANTPANAEALAVIHQGPKAWNNWRKDKDPSSFSLSGADLHDRDLTGVDLRAANLSNANLRGAKLGPGTLLWNANLSGADLYQANLRGADLQDVNFSNADLYQADLRESNLQGADLSTAKGGLLSRQLAGSDLTGATLPKPLENLYASLSSVKEISDSAQKLFLALLAGCLYSWLTIAQTTDVELITNRATTPLPIIQAAIPIVGFYVVAPLILLCLYFYFHFYLQKLWEELGSLPAVFTDGRELHKRTDPWLLNDLVRSHFVKLKDGRPFLSYFQSWISVVLAWWLVPITLFSFWLRFLRRHDLFWTMVHALLLSLAVFSAIRLYHIANRTLRGEERPGFRFKGMLWRRRPYLLASLAALLGALVIAMSLGTIFGEPYWPPGAARMGFRISAPRTWMPWLLDRAGYYPFANLKNADVSVKPPNWTGKKEEELDLVKAASLAGSDLRNADAAGGFFVRANLGSAHLEGANLRNANFLQANLQDAHLEYASLEDSNLQKANLEDAHLEYASLTLSHLQNASLRSAALQHAKLHFTNFTGANLAFARLSHAGLGSALLWRADLQEADLSEADLPGANLFGARLSSADLTGTKLDNTGLKYADFRSFHFEMLRGRVERIPAPGLTREMLLSAIEWKLAFYDPDMLKQLGLPPNHNEKLKKQMKAELKQAKSAATTPATPK